jgi:hypothetical protein
LPVGTKLLKKKGLEMQGDFNDIDSHEDDIDREVRKLIQEVEDRERIRRPMIELLIMLNSDLDPWA